MTVPDELFSVYYKDIYRYLYSLCRDVSLSEDLTSEVFLEVVKLSLIHISEPTRR